MGTVMMGTVKGDLHDIGKNLVIMMLEGAGFNVVDLGVDLSVEKVVEKVEEIRPRILGLSALLTTTMPEMKRVIEVLEQKGLTDGEGLWWAGRRWMPALRENRRRRVWKGCR